MSKIQTTDQMMQQAEQQMQQAIADGKYIKLDTCPECNSLTKLRMQTAHYQGMVVEVTWCANHMWHA